MTSERSKRRDFLALTFIKKYISKKLLIKNLSLPQKSNEVSQMELNAIKLAEEINAEYWSVSSKSGTSW